MKKKAIQLMPATVECYALHQSDNKFFTLQVLFWALVEHEDGSTSIEGYTTLGVGASKPTSEYPGFVGYQGHPKNKD